MKRRLKTKKSRGIFLVIEGGDGSGKATQLAELVKRFRSEGINPKVLDFPQYTKPSSYFVKEYLNGNYGSLNEVSAYRSSIFYAIDRFDASHELKRWLEAGNIVVANRYVSSNMGHQGAKFKTTAERKKFFTWLSELEYGIFGIPKPTATIILHVPATVAQQLVDKKGSREYIGGVKRDIHEANLGHLKRAEATYLAMAKLFPNEFRLVECTDGRRLLSVSEIHEKVWKIVRRYV